LPAVGVWVCFSELAGVGPFRLLGKNVNMKEKILFVCRVNRMRSATAHRIFEHDPRFEVRSAGTDETAAVRLTRELLEWADAVVVMEEYHRTWIRDEFPDLYAEKTIVCLNIEDLYDFMDPELISLLKLKFEDLVSRGLVKRKTE
jgi:predicted protein tyrosine phosphatase